MLQDPKAVELVDAIDFPFEGRFGAATATTSQWQALRALAFDCEVERFLAGHPGGTVVALGEGLETQFWRVDDGQVHWLSVDLRLRFARGRGWLFGCALPVLGGAPGVRSALLAVLRARFAR